EVDAVAGFFHSLTFLQTSAQLDGVDLVELLAAPGAPGAEAIGQKALVRRAVRRAEQTARIAVAVAVNTATATQSPPPPRPASPQLNLADVAHVGDKTSALAVACALSAATSPAVDVKQLLKDAGMEELPYHMQVLQKQWQLMNAFTTKAKADTPSRQPFMYVDITSADVLPMWIPAESIGGAVSGVEQAAFADGSQEATVSKLAAALKAASAAPRMFRTTAQWAGAFMRCLILAVGAQQLDWATGMVYYDHILKLAREEAMQRGTGAQRAERRDPALKLLQLAGKKDDQIWSTAMTRLQPFLKAIGVGTSIGSAPAPAGAGLPVAEESALAKQQAATDALARRSAQTARELAKQQVLMENRTNYLSGVADGGAGGADPAGRSFRADGKGGGKQGKRAPGQRSWSYARGLPGLDAVQAEQVLLQNQFEQALVQLLEACQGVTVPFMTLGAHRWDTLRWLLKLAVDLQPERAQWSSSRRGDMQKVVQPLHGPLFKFFVSYLKGPDEALARDLDHGLAYAGIFPKAYYSSKPLSRPQHHVSIDILRSHKHEINQQTPAALRDLPHAEDIMAEVQEDVDIGAMTPSEPLLPSHARDYLLTRRIPVREERNGEWKTRVADHGTESAVNLATGMGDATRHDTVDLMVEIMRSFIRRQVPFKSWKRDVKRAFRRFPIRGSHSDLAGSVWACNGQPWFSRHVGMPFGPTSAGASWHRGSNTVMAAMRTLLRIAAGRYVVDIFGADAVDCDSSLMRELGATFVAPELPEWALNVWAVQSEGIDLQVGTAEDALQLPHGRHPAVVIQGKTLIIRLRRRKHRPSGSVLRRSCRCDCVGRQSCVACVHRAWRGKFAPADGSRTYAGTSSQFRHKLRHLLNALGYPHAHSYTLKAFRAGKATELAQSGASWQQLQSAGEWRGMSSLSYVDAQKLDDRAFFESLLNASSDEEPDGPLEPERVIALARAGALDEAPASPRAEPDTVLDERILQRRRSSAGQRRRAFAEVVAEQQRSEGPATVGWLLQAHLEQGVTADQLNLPGCETFELAARRFQLWEEVYSEALRQAEVSGTAGTAADADGWLDERRLFLGGTRSKERALVAPTLERNAAAKMQEESAILKGRRKGREERRMARGESSSAADAGLGDPGGGGGGAGGGAGPGPQAEGAIAAPAAAGGGSRARPWRATFCPSLRASRSTSCCAARQPACCRAAADCVDDFVDGRRLGCARALPPSTTWAVAALTRRLGLQPSACRAAAVRHLARLRGRLEQPPSDLIPLGARQTPQASRSGFADVMADGATTTYRKGAMAPPRAAAGRARLSDVLPLPCTFRLSCQIRHGYHYGECLSELLAAGILERVGEGSIVERAGNFSVPKKGSSLRLIFDTRRSNAHFQESPHTLLSSGGALANLEVDASKGVAVASADVDCCYCQCELPPWARLFFGLPAVQARFLQPEARQLLGIADLSEMAHFVARVAPMGWSRAAHLIQEAHSHILGGVSPESPRIADKAPTPALGAQRSAAKVLYIDNVEHMLAALGERGIQASFDSDDGGLHTLLGHVLHKPSATWLLSRSKFWRLKFSFDFVLAPGHLVTGRELERLMGHIASAVMLQRPMLSPLWASVKRELAWFRALLPCVTALLSRPWCDRVTAADASPRGFGVAEQSWPVGDVRRVGGLSERSRFRGALTADCGPRDTPGEQQLLRASSADVVAEGALAHFEEAPAGRLLAEPWAAVAARRWRRAAAIHVLEAEGARWAVRRLVRDAQLHGLRHLVLGDNLGVASACEEGRAAHFALNWVCREVCAISIATGIQFRPLDKWINKANE
ncbi:unnamed protein product, partial [Prorocentrum cordatum]